MPRAVPCRALVRRAVPKNSVPCLALPCRARKFCAVPCRPRAVPGISVPCPALPSRAKDFRAVPCQRTVHLHLEHCRVEPSRVGVEYSTSNERFGSVRF